MAYVYRHIRHDKNEPFYIGVSKSDDYYKRANRKTQRNRHWVNIVQKTTYDVEIIVDNVSEQEAKNHEIYFINLYGRADLGTGILCNKTDGGDGGSNPSVEVRRIISNANKGLKKSPETIAKLKEANKNKIISKETRERMAAKLRGRKLPDWQRKILSEAAKGKSVSWCHKPIYQFDINGVYLNKFESIKKAATFLGLQSGNIDKALSGERLHTGDYIFVYANCTIEEAVGLAKQRLSLFAGRKTKTKKVINEITGELFESVKKASISTGIKYYTLKRRLAEYGSFMGLKMYKN